MGVKNIDILVCLIGRLVSWKGHEYFIKAIADIANKIPDIKGIIIGDFYEDYYGLQEPYYLKLLKLIEELKLNRKNYFYWISQ